MADITPAEIPASALPATGGTLERLFAWCALALEAKNGGIKYLEEPNGVPKDVMTYQIYPGPDGTVRVIVRANLAVNPNYLTDDSQQFWEFIEEITAGATPANYTV